MSRRSRRTTSDLLLSAAIGAVVLGPTLLGRGYVLRGDMVFVPEQPWKAAWLGLDGRVPRFVPGDVFLTAAGWLLPGDLVQKAVLVLVFLLGGWGIGRLVARHGTGARAAAIILFLWNPWVLERLAIGQWGVVVGYALLPWTVLAAERVRDDDRRGWPALVFWLGLAAVFSPASGLVALTVALGVLVVRPPVSRLAVALGAGLVVNLPWILPALVTGPALEVPEGQFAAFGARGESALGVVGSVLSLGGIWKSSVVPGERTEELVVVLSLLITAASLAGLWLATRTDRARVAGLGAVALLAVALALLTAVPAISAGLDDVARAVPAAGIVRDSHRYLGPVALALAVGIAATVDWLWERAVPGREAWRAVAALVAVAPLLALPSLAWGLGGQWRPVSYPAEWYTVRELVPAGRMVVLPWVGGYRGFSWNDRHAGLDPAPRFFPGDVLIDDRLLVGDRVIESEDLLLDDVRRALDSDDPGGGLRRLGVRSVLVEKDNAAVPAGLHGEVLHDGAGLALHDLGPGSHGDATGRPSIEQRRAVAAIDATVLLVWLAAAGLALKYRRRGHHE